MSAIELSDAALAFGDRTLWSGLELAVEPGEFVAVLGPNGSGKSSLLKVVLGLLPLSRGRAAVMGEPVRRGNPRVGYVPQHRGFAGDIPLRGRDFVQLGIDGNRWGPPSRRRRRGAVDDLLEQVGAQELADMPVGVLSGGEQQRLRIAQALATDPEVLLCDEPLLSLDLGHQRHVIDLLDQRRREHGTAVVFVTHEINPILAVTDEVLYIIDGTFRLGPPAEVMTSEVLSELYCSPVEVIRRGDKIVVLGADDAAHPPHHHHHDGEAAG